MPLFQNEKDNMAIANAPRLRAYPDNPSPVSVRIRPICPIRFSNLTFQIPPFFNPKSAIKNLKLFRRRFSLK
jgi:hypothetical protein